MIERQPAALAERVPRHVAIIMDGNRRWARERALPTIEGHRRGASALRRAVATGLDAGVEILTVYAFSEENWQRGPAEVGPLLRLVGAFAQRVGSQPALLVSGLAVAAFAVAFGLAIRGTRTARA